MMPPGADQSEHADEEIGHSDQKDHEEADHPLGQRNEHLIGADVLGIIVAVRRCVFDLAVVGHVAVLLEDSRVRELA